MPLQPFVPHRSALMPKAMRNSSLFRRMIRGSWVSETECCEGGAALAAALIVKTAKRASGIIFMVTSCLLRMERIALVENIAATPCSDKRRNLAQYGNLLMCRAQPTAEARSGGRGGRRPQRGGFSSDLSIDLSCDSFDLSDFTAAFVFSAPCLAASDTFFALSLDASATFFAPSFEAAATLCATSFAAPATWCAASLAAFATALASRLTAAPTALVSTDTVADASAGGSSAAQAANAGAAANTSTPGPAKNFVMIST